MDSLIPYTTALVVITLSSILCGVCGFFLGFAVGKDKIS